MRVFEQDGRINFVDESDVYVGFDYYSSCCESFGWGIHVGEVAYFENENGIDLEPFFFDTEFFESDVNDDWEGGGAVTFRLVYGRVRSDGQTREIERSRAADGLPTEIFLRLHNHHNGYYSHGFEMAVGGATTREGRL